MKNDKVSAKALIPFMVFVGVYLITGIVLNAQGTELAFYQLPSPVAAIIGIIVAFIMFKGSIEEKFDSLIKGCGNENIIIMCIIFLLAGAFSTVSKQMGGVDSVVNNCRYLYNFMFYSHIYGNICRYSSCSCTNSYWFCPGSRYQ